LFISLETAKIDNHKNNCISRDSKLKFSTELLTEMSFNNRSLHKCASHSPIIISFDKFQCFKDVFNDAKFAKFTDVGIDDVIEQVYRDMVSKKSPGI